MVIELLGKRKFLTTIPVITCFMSLKYWLYSGRWWIQIRSDFLPTALLGHAVSPVLVPSKWFILEVGASYLPVDIFHLFNSSWLKWNILPLSLQGFQDNKYGISNKKITYIFPPKMFYYEFNVSSILNGDFLGEEDRRRSLFVSFMKCTKIGDMLEWWR